MNPELLKRISYNVRYLRNIHGYTQDELADLLHIARSSYALLEKGTRGIPLDFLLQLCDLFKIKLNTLVEIDTRTFFRDITLASRVNGDLDEIITAYYQMSAHCRGRLAERARALLEEDHRMEDLSPNLPEPAAMHKNYKR